VYFDIIRFFIFFSAVFFVAAVETRGTCVVQTTKDMVAGAKGWGQQHGVQERYCSIDPERYPDGVYGGRGHGLRWENTTKSTVFSMLVVPMDGGSAILVSAYYVGTHV